MQTTHQTAIQLQDKLTELWEILTNPRPTDPSLPRLVIVDAIVTLTEARTLAVDLKYATQKEVAE